MPFGDESVAAVIIAGVGPMGIGIPVRWSAPVATGPEPMVVVPSPTATDPDVSWCGADWHCFNYGRRHWRRRDARGRSHNYRSRCGCDNNRCGNREAEVDTEMNPGVCSGKS